jgi:hypothetical protein
MMDLRPERNSATLSAAGESNYYSGGYTSMGRPPLRGAPSLLTLIEHTQSGSVMLGSQDCSVPLNGERPRETGGDIFPLVYL